MLNQSNYDGKIKIAYQLEIQMKNLKGVNLKMKKIANNRGITLIALVVTIIVLLILARCKYKYANRTKWDIK